jgi:hypothetical protein
VGMTFEAGDYFAHYSGGQEREWEDGFNGC